MKHSYFVFLQDNNQPENKNLTIPMSVGDCPAIFFQEPQLMLTNPAMSMDDDDQCISPALPLTFNSPINSLVEQGASLSNSRLGTQHISANSMSSQFTRSFSSTVSHSSPMYSKPQDVRHVNMTNHRHNKCIITNTDSDSMNSSIPSSSHNKNNINIQRRRYERIYIELQRSGLMEITIKTADLMKSNLLLSKQIKDLKHETAIHIRALFNNPNNRNVRNELLQRVIKKRKMPRL